MEETKATTITDAEAAAAAGGGTAGLVPYRIVRGDTLVVIEIEVLEPALFLDFDPASAERFAEATVRRL